MKYEFFVWTPVFYDGTMCDETGLRPLPHRVLELDCQFHLQAYRMRTLEEMCADTLTLEQET